MSERPVVAFVHTATAPPFGSAARAGFWMNTGETPDWSVTAPPKLEPGTKRLALMETKPEKFFRERGVRIKGYEMRLVRLEAQEEMLRYRGTPLTVLKFYRDNDEQVYDETRKVYRWGISTDGALLALMVWMISFAVLGLPALMFGGRSRAEA